MISSLPRFRHSAAIVAAVLYTAATFGALVAPSPASAQGSGAFYTAQLAAPAKDAKVIGGGVVWRCEGTSCVAAKGASAPATMCRKLQREVGQITGFAVKGEAMAEDKLAKCNA